MLRDGNQNNNPAMDVNCDREGLAGGPAFSEDVAVSSVPF